jgi:hypothetical protein
LSIVQFITVQILRLEVKRGMVANLRARGYPARTEKENAMTLKKELLDILACPQCKGELMPKPGGDGLACPRCKVVYPVKDDIPIMLVDQAVPEEEWTGSK